MSRFSKVIRQQIVEEFARRHNGTFNPTLFVQEVRNRGEDHPAFSWFEWDRDTAAIKWQIEQAREFARDLRVTFKVEEVGRSGPVKVRESVMPLVLSPMAGRRDGGGYYLADPEDPAHMEEHCRQAAAALRAWLNRYQSALLHVGGKVETFTKAMAALNAVAPEQHEAA